MPREKRCTRHTCQNRDLLAFCTSRYLFVDAQCAKLSGRDTERKFTVEMSEHWRPCFTQSSYNLMSLDDIRHHDEIPQGENVTTGKYKVRRTYRGNAVEGEESRKPARSRSQQEYRIKRFIKSCFRSFYHLWPNISSASPSPSSDSVLPHCDRKQEARISTLLSGTSSEPNDVLPGPRNFDRSLWHFYRPYRTLKLTTYTTIDYQPFPDYCASLRSQPHSGRMSRLTRNLRCSALSFSPVLSGQHCPSSNSHTPKQAGTKAQSHSPSSVGLPVVLEKYNDHLPRSLLGIFNYQLSRRDPSTWTLFDRTIATLILILYWGTSQWYLRRGDRPTGILTAVVGGLQGLTLVQ